MSLMRIWLVCAVTAAILSNPLNGESLQCADAKFLATAEDPAILNRTCQVAAMTRSRLAKCGVHLDRPIEITVSDRVENKFGSCLGIYHCGEDKLQVLTPSAMSRARKSVGPFALISDDVLWESIFAHELTHAAYDAVSCPFLSCIATSEYAAFAMQVWSLPIEERDRFGANIELKSQTTRDAISAIMYFLAPDRFAVIAWGHFQARPDSCAYMNEIMRGELFFDRPRH